FNVHLAADILREAAALTTQIEGQIIPSNVPGNLAMGVRQRAGDLFRFGSCWVRMRALSRLITLWVVARLPADCSTSTRSPSCIVENDNYRPG
ncbi:hypothetical protein, partial [Klebsiella pneumoniae]|uniref:hypothetical protein n=1 Tax=Klebsiella pneumoniae TaxID=573 RepID=UPI00210B7FE2